MFIHCYWKNKIYKKSMRYYNDDYSHIESKKIDMTLSGRYLAQYPFKISNSYEFDKYPNVKQSDLLVSVIKKKYPKLKNQSIIIGPGSNGIIQNVIKIVAKKNGNIVTPFLTFNQAEYTATSFNMLTKRVYMDNYKINLSKIEKAIDNKTVLVYICNPNNPTGIILSNKEIINFANRNKKVLILIDESNLEYSLTKSLLEEKIPSNILVLKSFSKAYGLANLRIGYICCNNNFYDKYKKLVTTNEFSGVSCICAYEVMQKDNYKENVKLVNEEKKYLIRELNKFGIRIIYSNSNTIMTETVFSREKIKYLNDNDISIVPIVDQKNEIHIRIAVQDHVTNKKFIEKLKQINFCIN